MTGTYEIKSFEPLEPKEKKIAQKIAESNPGLYLYTDGACWPNDGTGDGGWAYVIVNQDHEKILHKESCSASETTNNQMELIAIIMGLYKIDEKYPHEHVTVRSDSKYSIQGATEWVHAWVKNGWKTIGKKPVKNQGLWKELYALKKMFYESNRLLVFQWVNGHNGNMFNEIVDQMAQELIHEKP